VKKKPEKEFQDLTQEVENKQKKHMTGIKSQERTWRVGGRVVTELAFEGRQFVIQIWGRGLWYLGGGGGEHEYKREEKLSQWNRVPQSCSILRV